MSDGIQDKFACYLIVNGPLGMPAGKIAAQAFQAFQRLQRAYEAGECSSEQAEALEFWKANGTRTITRIAETPAAFERATRELPGIAMIDEGLTEIAPDSPTIHATWPLTRNPTPKMCQHKRVKLLEGPPIFDHHGGLGEVRSGDCLREAGQLVAA